MTARTVIESATGILFALSATIPDTYDAAGYGSTDIIWTTVGQVEDAGAEDANKAVSTFVPVATAVTTKVPGAIDYGKRSVTLGHLPGDAGQVLMLAAFKSLNNYSVKITFPDGELRYLDVLVTKFGMSGGKAGDVVRITSEIDICQAPVSVLP
jgi:hypothetical protein